MVDIVLVDPFSENCDRDTAQLESLHLAEVESYLRIHNLTTYRIEARQKGLSVVEVVRETLAQDPLCVSVWLQYRSLAYSLSFLAELQKHKHKRPFVVAEGNAATFSAKKLIQNIPSNQFDAVLLGEAEETLLEIVQALQKKQDWRNTPGIVYRGLPGTPQYSLRRQLPKNIDVFPHPFRRTNHFSSEEWVEIRSSRGCYSNCAFCNIRPFFGVADGPGWRGHSIDYILQELHNLHQRGVRRFYFVDEMFFRPGLAGKERVCELASRILAAQLDIEWQIFCRIDNIEPDLFKLMREAGLSTVNVGIEGGAQTQLDRMNKRQTPEQIENAIGLLRKLGIIVIPSFIMFDPYVTLEEIEANINLIRRFGFITYLGPSCIIPFEGTPLTEQIIADNLLDEEHPIVKDYIGGVRMINPEVETLRSAWSTWRPWVDEIFDNLATRLTHMAHTFYMNSTSQNRLDKDLLQIAQQLKEREADYVQSCIQQLQNGVSFSELLSLRSGWVDAIAQLNLAFSRLTRV